MAAAKKKKKKKGRGKKDSEYDAIVDRTAWHPYQHACGYESQQRVESIEAAFRSNLDGALTFHVKAEPHRDDAPEDDIPAYELTFRHDAPVLDVIARVREQEGIDESEALALALWKVQAAQTRTPGGGASAAAVAASAARAWAAPTAARAAAASAASASWAAAATACASWSPGRTVSTTWHDTRTV